VSISAPFVPALNRCLNRLPSLLAVVLLSTSVFSCSLHNLLSQDTDRFAFATTLMAGTLRQ